jgi:hypothetical protein
VFFTVILNVGNLLRGHCDGGGESAGGFRSRRRPGIVPAAAWLEQLLSGFKSSHLELFFGGGGGGGGGDFIIENKLGIVDANLFLKFTCVFAFTVTVFELFLVGGVQVFSFSSLVREGWCCKCLCAKFEAVDCII